MKGLEASLLLGWVDAKESGGALGVSLVRCLFGRLPPSHLFKSIARLPLPNLFNYASRHHLLIAYLLLSGR